MTSDGTKCYEYNDANQLKKVKNCSDNKTIAEYIYDHTGKRIVKKEYSNGVLERTTYSPSDEYETVVLASSGAKLNTTYYKVNDEMAAKKNPDGNINYYINDHLGSTSVLTDQTGTVLEKTVYGPYGEVKTGGIQSKFGYTGQEKDKETGLNYYDFRYYDPHISRFIQPDDIISDPYNPQTLNKYSYVKNNPVRYTDPTGHCPECVLFVGGGLALGGLEVVGAVSGFINSTDTSLGGRFTSAAVGAQLAVESQVGQLAFGAAFLGAGISAEGGSGITINTKSVAKLFGHTGRFWPTSLEEIKAMNIVTKSPEAGKILKMKDVMRDPRWPDSAGWVKMQQTIIINAKKITIHWNYNTVTGKSADFKYK